MLSINGLFEIGKFWKTGLKRGKIDGKGGVEEKFSIWHFRGGKSEKPHLSAYGRLCRKTAREQPPPRGRQITDERANEVCPSV